jgi:arylsulfatase A-like enzyme
MKKGIQELLLSSGLAAVCSVALNPCHALAGDKKPNVLFILADDFGYHDLSRSGSKLYETVNIDRIAARGMVFTNGYAACQVCSPSRASIMTGKFPARHGITDYIGASSGEKWRETKRFSKLLPAEYLRNLPAEYTILPEAMKQAGYKTFFAGKWHLGSKGSWPEDHGFDVNKGGWDAGSPKAYFAPYGNPNLPDGKNGEELSMRLARETVRFLEENNPVQTGQPVFAFLSFYAVHAPVQTTKAKWEKYRQKAEQLGIAASGYEMGRYLPIRQVQDNPLYAGLIESMDDAVGVVLNGLKRLGLEENTIVIFTSDNGGVASGDNYSTSNAPLRGGKGNQWEGGIREPYFMVVPWMKLAHKECDVPVSGTDFYPTILDLAGLPLRPGQHNDGVSLLPLLQGRKIPERDLIWHYPHYGNQGGEPCSILRRGAWKLIHYYEDGREELYNLKTDLSEKSNIAGDHPVLVKELSTKLFKYLYDVGAKFPEKDPLYSANAEKQYLDGIAGIKLPQLEEQRMKILSKDFDPKNNWWGSLGPDE